VINFDGTKIFPADIELALQQHPAVAEAAAFPVLVDGFRQRPVAAVLLKAPATPKELLAFGRERLGPRSPRDVHILDTFPRNGVGKVLKRELAERFSSRKPIPETTS